MEKQRTNGTVQAYPNGFPSCTLRAALYARVSTLDQGQTVENQLRDLRATAARHGWNVAAVYTDEASGAKGRDRRPGYDALCKAIARREIDLVAVWSTDRIARSLKHLVEFLGEMQAKHVDLYIHTQGLDTSTPGGKALFHMMGVFAELERDLIRQRVIAGMARARAEGKHLGRPSVSEATVADIRRLKAEGLSIRAIMRATGAGSGTVQRVIR